MAKFVDPILGIFSTQLDESFEISLQKQEFKDRLSARHTAEERVNFIHKYFKWTPLAPEVLNKYCKNPSTSRTLREKGNGCYKSKQLKFALEYYNLATMFAPENDEELGMAYANRSAVLVELGEPQDALIDMDLALLNKYPESLYERLGKRKERCLQILRKREDVTGAEAELKRRLEWEVAERRKIRETMMHIENPNPMMPAAANFVQMKYDKVVGRQLIVTEDIPAGTVVMVEQPYVAILENHAKWNTSRCHYCLKLIKRGIPCNSCVFAIYCNESCRLQGYTEFHMYECHCMRYLHWESLNYKMFLAFRIICKTGPKKLLELFLTRDPAYFDHKEPYGMEAGCQYGEDPYLSLYHLFSNLNKVDHLQNYGLTQEALLLASVLEKETKFFEGISEDCKSNFTKFVATLILHHYGAITTNPESLDQVMGIEALTLEDFYRDGADVAELGKIATLTEFSPFGWGIYSLYSLLNHSCYPNVYHVCDFEKGTVIVATQRALKSGEILYGNYGRRADRHSVEERQEFLLSNYHFRCRCVACKNGWDRNSMLHFNFCCSQCSKTFSMEEKSSPSSQFKKKCVLKDPDWKCGLCGKRYSQSTLFSQLTSNSQAFLQADKLFFANYPREAIERLKTLMEFFQFSLCPPHDVQNNYELLLAHAMALIFHYAQ